VTCTSDDIFAAIRAANVTVDDLVLILDSGGFIQVTFS